MFKNKLAKKIIIRILIIETSIFIILLPIFYYSLIKPLRNNVFTQIRDTNVQIVQLCDNTLASMKGIVNILISSSELTKSLDQMLSHTNDLIYVNRFELALNNLTSVRSNVRGISIQLSGGDLYQSSCGIYDEDLSIYESSGYKDIAGQQFISGLSKLYEVNINGSSQYSVAFYDSLYIRTTPVTITIFYNVNDLVRSLNAISRGSFDHYALLDKNYDAFFASDPGIWTSQIGLEAKNKNVTADTLFKSDSGYNYMTSLLESNWIFISNVTEDTVFAIYSGYLYTLILCFLLIYVLTVILINPIIASFLKPIRILATQMKQVSEGKLDKVTSIKAKDEIGELSDIFCTMMESINRYIIIMLQKEKDEQRMKYGLLVSQIDPHFIYNTIGLINSMAKNKKNEEIVIVNTALIRILQDRLRVNNIEIYDSIEHEINIVKQYIEILNYRYINQVEITWDISYEMYPVQIPKNIIQPLIENAFFHGLIDKIDGNIKGNITVSIFEDGDNINIVVEDDGYGMSPEKISEVLIHSKPGNITRGKHIGLANIHERLSYLTGNQNCIQISSKEGNGTKVKLIIKQPKYNNDK